MVRLTAEYIAKCNSHTKRKRDESTSHYLKRITHLYMAEKNIETIDNLSLCRNLTVLYLYDNKLNKTMNLGTAQNLTHLYLQNNNISKIEGLKHLQRLTKLYLGYNNLLVIEDLQSLEHLKELNVEYQRLPPGEKLLFEPRTLLGLRKCLKCLNISGNHIDSFKELEVLGELSQLQACDNEIAEFDNIQSAMLAWRQLLKLDLTGNPICHKAKYRDKIIVMSQSLETLDGREITRLERQFLISWKASREARRRHRLESQKNEFGDDMMDLPPVQHHSVAPTPPPHYMMGGLPGGRKRFEAILAKSRSLPNSAAVKLFSKQKLPYTTPMGSTLIETEALMEKNGLGKKSLSDLTDKRRLDRQMTPHPNRRPRGMINGFPTKVPNASPVHTVNGSKTDVLGSGEHFKNRKTQPQLEAENTVDKLKNTYGAQRALKLGFDKTGFNGAILSERYLQERGESYEGLEHDLKNGSQKLSNLRRGKESLNEEGDFSLVTANGRVKDTAVINGQHALK